ncbi:MAG: hypothetical protein HQL71_04220 [Magnetococcales bacterium]|nr:hypothetical protein [Magnetococcales bacterium]
MYKNRILTACLFIMLSTPANAVEFGPVEVHGFLSQGYMHSSHYDFLTDSNGGTARFNEFGVNFMYDFNDDLRAGMQIVSRDMGYLEDNSPKIDWAFADYHYKDWLGLRLGKVKIPLGIYNDVLDVDAARSQIVPPMSVYNFYLRDLTLAVIGGSVYGNVPIDKIGDFDYTIYAGNVPLEANSSLEGMMEIMSGSSLHHAENDYAFGGNIKWNSTIGLALNASYVKANEVITEGNLLASSMPYKNEIEATATSFGAEFVWNDLTFLTEYLAIDQDINATITTPIGNVVTDNSNTMDGWYAQVSYKLTEEFEASTYYSASYRNGDDENGQEALAAGTISKDYQAWHKDLAITGRYDLNEDIIIKIEGHLIDGAALVFGTPDKRYWNFWAVKATYMF